MSDSVHKATGRTTRERLLRLLRRTPSGKLRRRPRGVTLAELEDSGRPLLFARLPRMLRGDGTTPALVQAFGYVDQDQKHEHAVTVSARRWSRALETSRRFAAGRSARRRR